MTAQRLQKWLKAASDQTAQGSTVNFYLADSRGALYPVDGRGADETDLDSLYRELLSHAGQATERPQRGNRRNYALST